MVFPRTDGNIQAVREACTILYCEYNKKVNLEIEANKNRESKESVREKK